MDLEIPQINILIVEDTESVRKTLRQQLSEFGHQAHVQEASGVESAWRSLSEQHGSLKNIEFIFCDWMMPGKDGIALLNMVRKDKRFKHLPFVFITSVSEKEHILHAIRSGVDNYLTKPWEVSELRKRFISTWQKHLELQEKK